MLERAKERRMYDALFLGDLVKVMWQRPGRFDVVFAADVFIYVGELADAMRAAQRALSSQGLLAFTAELSTDGDCRLQSSQRYAHSPAYLRRMARQSGFGVRRMRTATIRFEYGQPVRAAIVVLQKK
jgi:predicted TPR repeat methyltransferase